ncbi:EamA family transporter [Bacillus vallismortis]|uniref:EamA family transporter n=1 Tax=Bacillus TaxID=1386 RepID=UPI00057C31F2|nr:MULTISPECIES: DMT family transporter [Bacillus]PJY99457.1 EamA family transporter [Bacillus vallismortis]
MATQKQRIYGFFMVIVGAAFWGLSGTAAQHLFETSDVSVEWLVTVRLLLSGVLLLMMICAGKNRRAVWGIWKDQKSAIQLIVFGIAGMLGVQYTFLASIGTGNAAVATLLQYLAPVLIMLFLLVTRKNSFQIADMFALVLALGGTFLLLTNGSVNQLTVSSLSVIWGLLSAAALAFYTLYSSSLLKKWGSALVVGWGMLIGGIGMSFIHPPWDVDMQGWTVSASLLVGFIVIFGTLLGFYMYLTSLKYLFPQEASMLGCTEPVAAVASSILWLGVPFGLYQALGAACILVMIFVLSQKKSAGKTAAVKKQTNIQR